MGKYWNMLRSAVLLAAVSLSGCSGLNESLEHRKASLEKQGVEFHSGNVMRVFRF